MKLILAHIVSLSMQSCTAFVVHTASTSKVQVELMQQSHPLE